MAVKILVVDDVAANRLALAKLISKLNLEIVEATSGYEALQRVLEHDFALLLLDVQMPEMDGFEVIEMLKQIESTRHLPVLLMTAFHKDDDHRLKGYLSGSVDYIEKPIQENVLLAKIQVFVDLHRQKIRLQDLVEQLNQTNEVLQSQISQRVVAENAARDSEQRYCSLLANVPGTVYRCLAVEPYAFQLVSPAIEDLCGYSPTQFEQKYSDLKAFVEIFDRSWVLETIHRAQDQFAYRQSTTFSLDYRIRHQDGALRWVNNRGQVIEDESGCYIDGVMIDITEKKTTEEELRIAATVFETHDGVFVMDQEAYILRINRSFSQITGYPPKDIIGQTPRLLQSNRHNDEFDQALWQSLEETGHWQGEIWHRRRNGDEYPTWQTITTVKDESGVITHYVAVFSDITERKNREQLIQQLAYQDSLTGLYNRRALLDRLRHEIAIARRHRLRGALIFIDLDKFKILNDSFGHDAGDELLRQVAMRLMDIMREEDTVARLGGDEFVVLMRGTTEEHDRFLQKILGTAKRIQTTLGRPFQLSHHACTITPSIGITVFPDRAEDVYELLKQADIAMYQVKAAGRDGICFFHKEMQVEDKTRR